MSESTRLSCATLPYWCGGYAAWVMCAYSAVFKIAQLGSNITTIELHLFSLVRENNIEPLLTITYTEISITGVVYFHVAFDRSTRP